MYNNYMFRPCNRAIVRLLNRDHQIDYIIGVFLGGGRDLALLICCVLTACLCEYTHNFIHCILNQHNGDDTT